MHVCVWWLYTQIFMIHRRVSVSVCVCVFTFIVWQHKISQRRFVRLDTLEIYYVASFISWFCSCRCFPQFLFEYSVVTVEKAIVSMKKPKNQLKKKWLAWIWIRLHFGISFVLTEKCIVSFDRLKFVAALLPLLLLMLFEYRRLKYCTFRCCSCISIDFLIWFLWRCAVFER